MTKYLLMLSLFLVFTGCSLKEYRLFQDDNEKITYIDDAQYQEDVQYDNIITADERVTVMVYNQSSQGASELGSMISTRGGNVNQGADSEALGQLVSKQGTVRLPLIGKIKVAGLTEAVAVEMLTNEYKKYLRQPFVSVELTNQRIVMIGEIKRPGVVTVSNGNMTLIEAIARSGDLTDYAERTNIKILRGDLRDPEVRIVDLTNMASMKLSSMILKPNDIVYIQPRDGKGNNLAFREVAPPFQLLTAMLQPFVNIFFLSQAVK